MKCSLTYSALYLPIAAILSSPLFPSLILGMNRTCCATGLDNMGVKNKIINSLLRPHAPHIADKIFLCPFNDSIGGSISTWFPSSGLGTSIQEAPASLPPNWPSTKKINSRPVTSTRPHQKHLTIHNIPLVPTLCVEMHT